MWPTWYVVNTTPSGQHASARVAILACLTQQLIGGSGPWRRRGYRLVEIISNPAWRIDTYPRSTHQRREAGFKPLEFVGADLQLPFVAELVEDGFTFSHDLRNPRAVTCRRLCGVQSSGISLSCHVPALLEHPRRFLPLLAWRLIDGGPVPMRCRHPRRLPASRNRGSGGRLHSRGRASSSIASSTRTRKPPKQEQCEIRARA